MLGRKHGKSYIASAWKTKKRRSAAGDRRITAPRQGYFASSVITRL
jgi:hypothetical protein